MSEAALPAMILAAGYGTRLRPLSDRIAKPLLPVCGVTLLEIAARRLVAAGATALGVNVHHRGGTVAAFAEALVLGVPVTVFGEETILGTGGGIGNARALLGIGRRFLVHNGDVLSDLDLRALLDAHDATGALATLALVDRPEVNTVAVDEAGIVTGIDGDSGASDRAAGPAPEATGRRLTYTGIAVFDRRFLEFIPEGVSSLVPALRAAMAADPRSVRGHVREDLYWNDLGTVRRYLDVHRDLLAAGRAPALVAELAALAPRARYDDASECVVLAGATVAKDAPRRAVVGPGWTVTEAENDRARLVAAAESALAGKRAVDSIAGHGSDRRFDRLREEELTAVLMRSPADDAEFDRYVAIGRFLHANDFGGPEVLHVDGAQRAVLMEDLGDRSLHAIAHDPESSPETLRRVYRRVLARLVDLQTRGTGLVAEGACPEASYRLFDHATLRWETDYFRLRFLHGVMGIHEEDLRDLDGEFEALADAALEQPVVLMHRDFQSQNILLQGETVRFVDFQGMRRGPLLYDVMSLLRDAYVNLGPPLRDALLEDYGELLAAAGGPALLADELRELAVVAGLQRNMQALGAFGFLSAVKGKARYRDFIPLGLRHLAEGLAEAEGSKEIPPLPRLTKLVLGLSYPPE